MTSIVSEVQKLEQDAIVTFCTIDATSIGGGIFAFTHSRNGPIVFDTITYQPLDFETEGFEVNGSDEPAVPTLRIQTTDSFVPAFIRLFGDGKGAIFTRYRTYRRFLDDGEEPDPQQIFPPEVYYIERKSRDNRKEGVLEWELSSILDQEGLEWPLRQIVRGYCDYAYRRWNSVTNTWIQNECPYDGTRCYDVDGNVTTDKTKDRCGKKLTDCKLRFGQNVLLPYRGFPGARRVR